MQLLFLHFSDLARLGYSFARYITSGDKKFLFHDGHRFYKNAESKGFGEGDTKVYWRCAGYQRFQCMARATTQVIDGYDMVKFKNRHSDPPEIFPHLS